MTPENYYSIGFGAVLGFASAVLLYLVKATFKWRNRRKYGKKLLRTIIAEIEEGIGRCEYYLDRIENKEISYSRIYTGFWDSVRLEIIQIFKSVETLSLLHSIYYRFDLVNFCMVHSLWEAGLDHAKVHLPEIRQNLSALNTMLSKKRIVP